MIQSKWTVGMLVVLAWAGQVSAADSKDNVIIYKWNVGNAVHYSTIPPRVSDNVRMLNREGLPITDDQAAKEDYEALRLKPVRPGEAAKPQAKPHTAQESAPSTQGPGQNNGIITRQQRCTNAQANLKMLESGQRVNIEDDKGNLIPLTSDQKALRLRMTKDLISRLCQ